MWGLICEPRPSVKRPSESAWTSFACSATVIGLRAKATAIEVPIPIVSVRSAAIAQARKGSIWVSNAAPAVVAIGLAPGSPRAGGVDLG